MIHIFEPPAKGRLTGGYLYNARVVEHLGAARHEVAPAANPRVVEHLGVAALHEVAPAALAGALAAHAGERLLVDSLYLGTPGLPELMARHRAIALVHHLPTCDPGNPPRAAQRQGEADYLAAAASAVVTSDFMAAEVRRRAGDVALIVAPPGVDDVFFAVAPDPAPGDPEVLTIANLEPRKGVLEHVAPLARAAGQRAFHWHLIGDDGDPAYAGEVRAAIAAAGLAPRVTLHGRLERAALCERLRRATVHLFPSRFESYGMVVAESLAAGLPVVTPAIGELPRLLGDGAAGALAPPGDPQALIDVLCALLSDGARLAALRRGCAARRRALRRWPAVAAGLAAALAAPGVR